MELQIIGHIPCLCRRSSQFLWNSTHFCVFATFLANRGESNARGAAWQIGGRGIGTSGAVQGRFVMIALVCEEWGLIERRSSVAFTVRGD